MNGKLSKGKIMSFVCATIIFIGAIYIYVKWVQSKPIYLNQFATIDVNGIDGYGTIDYTIDYDSILKMVDKNDISKDILENGIQLVDSYDSAGINGFSNGDVVILRWKIDDIVSSKMTNPLEYRNIEYKVSSLKEIETFDAFANIDVAFEGTAPNGTAQLINNNTKSDVSGNLSYFLDKSDGLSNGDTVTVKISYGNSDDVYEAFANDYNVAPENISKTYEVVGLSSGELNAADVSLSSFEGAISQGEDQIRSIIANADSTWRISDMQLDCIYLCIGKYSNDNCVIILYKITGVLSDDNESFFEFYKPIMYKNLVINTDGVIEVNYQNYEISNNVYSIKVKTDTISKTVNVSGYENQEVFYSKYVESKLDNYSIDKVEE